ncbi:hypothetical protein [Komagataeibacter diospyri]|uniref:hypothetical protein n=1 Tax=Komagataeibacter diospyri TaxID=1932662 RepID=UPI003757A7C0
MIKNLKLLYGAYGGWSSFFASPYPYVSSVLTCASWNSLQDGSWASVTSSIMPSITGFSIASFAIIISVSDERSRRALMIKRRGDYSPLVKLSSSVSHAVIVQTVSLLFSAFFQNAKIIDLHNSDYPCILNFLFYLFSTIGIFFLFYGLLLVVAEILSIFKFLTILSNIEDRLVKKQNTHSNPQDTAS